MSEWRPEGWENPLTPQRLAEDHNDFEDVAQAYESGADAMVAALRGMGIYVEMEEGPATSVIIPDEKA